MLGRGLAELLPGVKNFVTNGLGLNLSLPLFSCDSARYDTVLLERCLEIMPKTYTSYVADELSFYAVAAHELTGMAGTRRTCQV
jgi:hypothetical protein